MRIAAFLVAVMITLCGCSKVADVHLRLMVYAIGVDLTDSGEFEVSYQVFDSKESNSSAPVGTDESNVKVVTATGKSLFDCEKSIELQTGKEFFAGDAETVVLGDSLKGEDLGSIMSYFRNSTDIYLGVNVVFSSGSAKDAITVNKNKGPTDPHTLSEMLSASVSDSSAISSRLIEISNALSASNALAMPIITIENDEENKPYAKELTTNMLIKGGSAVDVLSEEESKGAKLLAGSAEMISVEIPMGGYVSSAVIKIKDTKRSIYISDEGYPVMTVNISGELSVTENPSSSEEEALRRAAQNQLIDFCDQAYNKAIKTHSADIFEIMMMLKKYEPEYAKTAELNTEDVVGNTQIRVFVSLKIY